MKNLLVVTLLSLGILVGSAHAQLPPNYDGKGTIAVKTDPVLSAGPGLALTVPVPKSLAGLSLNFASPQLLEGFSLNFRAAYQMVALLEARGAKVSAYLSEIKGVTMLNLVVDGKKIDPIAVECRDCVIVFEY